MKQYSIEGIATIQMNRFHFESGLPAEESVVEPRDLRGRLLVHENADVEFRENPKGIVLPPCLLPIGEGEGWKLKRSTQNYIIQLKVPIGESRSDSQRRIDRMLPEALGEMTLDREELYEEMVA